MQPDIFAALLAFPSPAFFMFAAGLALLVIGFWAAKGEFAQARGLDKLTVLANMCFAAPLAVFGTLHLSAPQIVLPLVPSYMPWQLFWVYFVGCSLIAAGLSIATRIQVRWSGLLVGIMMFLFVGMLYLPGAVRGGSRFVWTIVFRESSFGSAGWVLAGIAIGALSVPGKSLINVGRVLIALAAIVFGVQHFVHPLGMPVIPLQKEMPGWIPARALIDYLTGAFLVIAGVCFLARRKTRVAAAYLGGWILLLIVVIYLPVMIGALGDPKVGVEIEGINYFYDTLLFGGVVLSLARAMTVIEGPQASKAVEP